MCEKQDRINELELQLKKMAETEKIQSETVKFYAERDRMFWETKNLKQKYYFLTPVAIASATFAILQILSKFG